MTMRKKRVLVLCTGNSCRSQMAEGYLRHFAGDRAEVYSAGMEPKGVHPLAVSVMAHDGIGIAHHTSDHVDKYRGMRFDLVLTVCDHANEQCPYFPGQAQRIHHGFPDPAAATGTEAEVEAEFERVRRLIRDHCHKFVQEHL